MPIRDYFAADLPLALYVYDFGDDWRHVVVYEGTSPEDPSTAYPRCVGGARACPPEDCGGVHGYAEFLATISDRRHPEHAELLAWVDGHYDPDGFDPNEVVFDDPRERWEHAFEE